jgi:hypothetical protein
MQQINRIEPVIVYSTLLVAAATAVLQNLQLANVVYVSYIAVELLWVYAIYWAFSIRHLLSAKLFRNQALGIGLVALVWLAFNAAFYIENNFLEKTLLSLAVLVTFYWVDSSILASRKSDPLYRNIIHWSRLRLALWPALIIFVAILFPFWQLVNTANSMLGRTAPLFPVLVLFALGFELLASGTIFLLAAAVRSKDRTLRRHLFWFGLFVMCFFGSIILWGLTGLVVFNVLAYLGGSYCVYRSAKSLAPINEIPKIERSRNAIGSS